MASANPNAGGLSAREPAVVVLDLPSRDEALLFVINGQITNTRNPINSRKELAAAAGVSESTYDAGKLILKAVEEGTAEPEVIEDVRTGKGSIHGVAKRLKAKPAAKAKSGWKAAVNGFATFVRCVINWVILRQRVA